MPRTKRARPEDRRALSKKDVDELLAARDSRTPDTEYDPLFWNDLEVTLTAAGKALGDRLPAWRIIKDFRYLRRHGWYPSGQGFIWEQLDRDLRDKLLPYAGFFWRVRLRQAIRWMDENADHFPPLRALVS